MFDAEEDCLLHIVGKIPHIADICSMYCENIWENMRYCIFVSKFEEGLNMWGKYAKSSRDVSMIEQNKEENYMGYIYSKARLLYNED